MIQQKPLILAVVPHQALMTMNPTLAGKANSADWSLPEPLVKHFLLAMLLELVKPHPYYSPWILNVMLIRVLGQWPAPRAPMAKPIQLLVWIVFYPLSPPPQLHNDWSHCLHHLCS